MRTAPNTCHGLTTPLFALLLLLFCCESDLEHSAAQDARWLRRIERRWEGNLGGRPFALTFCEDRWANARIARQEEGCAVDHLVRSEWQGNVWSSAARGCGGCELDVIALVRAHVTTADGLAHAIDGQLTLGSAYDGDLDDNGFAFDCRHFSSNSGWEDGRAPEVADATAPGMRHSEGMSEAAVDLVRPRSAGEGAAPSCETLAGVEILANGALSIRGEVLRALGYASVNVPLLYVFPSTSAGAECGSGER